MATAAQDETEFLTAGSSAERVCWCCDTCLCPSKICERLRRHLSAAYVGRRCTQLDACNSMHAIRCMQLDAGLPTSGTTEAKWSRSLIHSAQTTAHACRAWHAYLICIPHTSTSHIYTVPHTPTSHTTSHICVTHTYTSHIPTSHTPTSHTYLTYLPHIPTSHAYLTLQTCLVHALTSSHNHVLTLYPTHLSISHPLHAPGAGIHTCACTAEWQPCSKCSSARGTSRYFPEQRVSEARVMESEARL